MAETTWSYSIQDFSPLVTYSGSTNSGQGFGLDPAWQQTCPSGSVATSIGSPSSVTICDLSSIHTTSVKGASFSLPFYGVGIQLLGNVTTGMEYSVTIDGVMTQGTPGPGQILSSASNLALGNHTAVITADPSTTGSTLSFEGATVTVGTGRTGATVTLTIVQDTDSSITYTPPYNWFSNSFDSYAISHSSTNQTWHQADASSASSLTLPFSGNAVLIYGLSRSWSNDPYRVALDDGSPTTYFGNSALSSNTSQSSMYTDGLLFFHASPSNSSHQLTMDNDNGGGVLALDYVEIITITGGSPLTGSSGSPAFASSTDHLKHSLIAAIVGSIVGFLILSVLLTVYIIRIRRRRANWKQSLENASASPFKLSPRAHPTKTMSDAPSVTASSPLQPPFSPRRGYLPSPLPIPSLPPSPETPTDPPTTTTTTTVNVPQRNADLVLDPEPEHGSESGSPSGPQLGLALPLGPASPSTSSPTQASPLSPSETQVVRRILLALTTSPGSEQFPMQGGEAVELTRRHLVRSGEYPYPPPPYVPPDQ